MEKKEFVPKPSEEGPDAHSKHAHKKQAKSYLQLEKLIQLLQ